MVVTEAVNASTGLVLQVGKIALWMKAAGIAALIWVVFESAALWLNYRRLKDVAKIKDDMKRIESKLDRALKGKR